MKYKFSLINILLVNSAEYIAGSVYFNIKE
jgi:hypothetical protein